jgi:uncharacterized protein (TIGR03083 family)
MAGIDIRKVADAYLDQWSLTREWCDGFEDWLAPSAVEGWTVRELVAHFGLVANTIVATAARVIDERPIRLGDYIASYADVAEGIYERTREVAVSDTFLFAMDASAEQAQSALRAVEGNPVVGAPRGPIRWVDFLRTRCIELTVHTDDLVRSAAAVGVDGSGPTMSRPCLQVSTRALADVLRWRAPGRSVEVRVPPFTAVQCIAGVSHKRGTPPAVVETDPVTFCRLAAGRTTWSSAAASGALQFSGLRTDLTPYFPLL